MIFLHQSYVSLENSLNMKLFTFIMWLPFLELLTLHVDPDFHLISFSICLKVCFNVYFSTSLLMMNPSMFPCWKSLYFASCFKNISLDIELIDFSSQYFKDIGSFYSGLHRSDEKLAATLILLLCMWCKFSFPSPGYF